MSTLSRMKSPARRGFNLVELLMALAITAALLTATMVALNASYMAYQHTTRAASTHTISRLAMDRMLTLIRTGEEFGPLPSNPNDPIVESDFIEIITMPDENGVRQGITIEWDELDNALYVELFNPETGTILGRHLLLEGVIAQMDGSGNRIRPFTLEFERGRHLFRATIDLSVVPDDNLSLEIEGSVEDVIRLVATAMPRLAAYRDQ
jgi:prepilin-type N-terminal cleavage/methylation domain-containing protein